VPFRGLIACCESSSWNLEEEASRLTLNVANQTLDLDARLSTVVEKKRMNGKWPMCAGEVVLFCYKWRVAGFGLASGCRCE
jgi:hypothetical protein